MDKTVREAFKDFGTTVLEAFEAIKNAMIEAYETITAKREYEKHDYNWHVPKSIVKNHQVLNRKPLFAYIRNRL